MMNNHHNTVAVAMSGGVDSSVAAALLKEQGYSVIGLTMHLWDYDGVGGNVFNESSCCSVESMDDARAVCQRLDIPHYVVDVREEFRRQVIRNFIDEYLEGRTPNPCILCNSIMKWKVLFNKAKQIGASFLATGHYAQVAFDEKLQRYILKKGSDPSKDQSYALWALTQQQLKYTIFPLGRHSKSEVRYIAAQLNLKTKQKSESQEICFIPDNDYRRFLREQVPELELRLHRGQIVDTEGRVLGTHDGYPFFTIGQRRKLGIAVGKPLYVTQIDAEQNRIVVGEKEELQASGLFADKVNWIAMGVPPSAIRAMTKIRYNDNGKMASIYPLSPHEIVVQFEEQHQAVTPGQSVVFYQQENVVGGGVIARGLTATELQHIIEKKY